MLTLTGEVRKVLESNYTNRKTGELVNQAILVLEPPNERQNYEISLTSKQLGLVNEWEKNKGNTRSIEVSLYVNYEHGFYKFTAVTGKPLESQNV